MPVPVDGTNSWTRIISAIKYPTPANAVEKTILKNIWVRANAAAVGAKGEHPF